MTKYDDAQTITGEVNINYVLTAYSKKLTSVMGENILLQVKLSEVEDQNINLTNELTRLKTKVNNGNSNKNAKKSETANSVPTTSDIVVGEMAVNTADKKIYIRDSSDDIVTLRKVRVQLLNAATQQYILTNCSNATETEFCRGCF